MKKRIGIAIDGPSGVGKSTLAKSLAERYGYLHIDTGALYRAIGLYAYTHKISPKDPKGLREHFKNIKLELRWVGGAQHIYLCGEDVSEDIRQPLISMYASDVSALCEVREFLLDTQREFARNHDVVMDGRDIGTVVLPEAQVKIFMTADADTRARRRYEELLRGGKKVTFGEVYEDMLLRDSNDSKRQLAPCIPARDAILFDNSGMEPEETFRHIAEMVEDKLHDLI